MKKNFFLLITFSFVLSAFAQDNVGIGTISPHPRAILELNAADKGFLMVRMNSTDTALPGLNQEGMFFYARDVDEMYFYDDSKWQPVPKGRVYWEEGTGANIVNLNSGNVGIGLNNPGAKLNVVDGINDPLLLLEGSGFIGGGLHFTYRGTTEGYEIRSDDQGGINMEASGFHKISFQTDGTERMRITPNGNVGIGTSSPSTALEVNGVITGDGSGLTNIAGQIPIGGIIMWSGSAASIPAGWALCNGTNGTPNLSSRFIRSANSTGSDINSIGGADSRTLSVSNLPSHNHFVNLTTNSLNNFGAHTHCLSENDWSSDEGGNGTTSILWDDQDFGTINLCTVPGQGGHVHGVTGNTNNTGSGASFDNRPAYYTLAFIMRIL